ncbi:MAG: UDP-2,3-diacylglucosamine diphosphatase LpxI [Magnetococcales bacterium]|nr:UDP-2,3-diacylglucosamine diphosphatase LpxI [Magnetococcales bacterium]
MGIIAGSGWLPVAIARAVKERDNLPVVAVGHLGETDPSLASWVDAISWVRLGQFGRIIDYLAQQKARRVVLAGGIVKSRIWQVRPDWLAMKLVARLHHLHDDLLLRGIGAELESRGFDVVGVADLLPGLLVPEGLLTPVGPTPEEWEDIRFGWVMAKQLGQLDIGQGVVVHRRNVVAVEAMEGTDAMIRRAGELLRKGGVLVKVVKPTQDRRFDLPSVGPKTVDALAAAGLSVLALEAGGVLLLEPEETLARAKRAGIVLLALSPSPNAAVELGRFGFAVAGPERSPDGAVS